MNECDYFLICFDLCVDCYDYCVWFVVLVDVVWFVCVGLCVGDGYDVYLVYVVVFVDWYG